MAPKLTKTYGITAVFLAALFAAPLSAQGVLKIGERDQLTITVFGVEALSGKFPVGADGTVTYPQIGSVRAAGLTTRELEAVLTKSLKEGGLLLNPQVTVELVQTQNKRVIITGAIRSPGPLTYAGQLTLFEALALAGSTTSDAGDLVLVVRSDVSGGTPVSGSDGESAAGHNVIEVSLSQLQSGRLAENNVVLQDGDQIVVPRALQVFISGQVRSPGGFTVAPGTTVLQSITLAGGVTDRGTMRGLKILRNKKEVKNVKPDTVVEPGDTIIVKASPF